MWISVLPEFSSLFHFRLLPTEYRHALPIYLYKELILVRKSSDGGARVGNLFSPLSQLPPKRNYVYRNCFILGLFPNQVLYKELSLQN